jgi:hypothetical protein
VDMFYQLLSGYGQKQAEEDPYGFVAKTMLGNLVGAATGSILANQVVQEFTDKGKPSLKSVYGPVGPLSTVASTSKKIAKGENLNEKDAKNLVKGIARLAGIPILGGVIDIESFVEDRANNVPLGTIKK